MQGPHDIAAIVGEQYGSQLDSMRAEIFAELGRIGPPTRLPARRTKQSLIAPSVLMPDAEVHLSWMAQIATPFGTFGRDHAGIMLTVSVGSFAVGTTLPKSLRGVEAEEEGWARAALGREWADHAYRVDTFSGLTGGRPVFFPVLVDVDGTPQLAPSDFQWPMAGAGGPVTRRKLVPDRSQRQLIAYLRRHGDEVPVEDIEAPAGEPDIAWAAAFIGHLSVRLAYLAAREEQRGNRLSVERIELAGNELTAVLSYQSRGWPGHRSGLRIDVPGWRQHLLGRTGDGRALTAATHVRARSVWEKPRSSAGAEEIVWTQLP
ncbi:hypothetical protein [Rhodococcus marinonascens]|uniref:hypothetical protein n=1 Tax=Rhodococcus marinonascens TaxID=38311 RepID=UPI001114E84E|nr:hypothetical protein [Rhodococcus marinonascens]